MDKRVKTVINVCLATGVLFLLSGCVKQEKLKKIENTNKQQEKTKLPVQTEKKQIQEIQSSTPVEFSKFGADALFLFSGQISNNWDIEYIPEIESVNIFNKNGNGSSLDRSQIFIRYFKASKFLTLSTVDILKREETQMNEHEAVRYEIVKKPNIPNFAQQPLWRSQRHSLIDIRFSDASPTLFYVFAKNPELAETEFEQFISSLVFHNDTKSFVPPLDNAASRVTKKPYGIFITPSNSPVQPERFLGYHTGADFEMLNEKEIKEDMSVSAICGGKLKVKQNANGYGGVVVQECLMKNEPITVIYGHLDYKSVQKSLGSYMSPNEIVGILGEHQSIETDNERKHLHLGIHKGKEIDLRGYVAEKTQLSQWLDPCTLLCE